MVADGDTVLNISYHELSAVSIVLWFRFGRPLLTQLQPRTGAAVGLSNWQTTRHRRIVGLTPTHFAFWRRQTPLPASPRRGERSENFPLSTLERAGVRSLAGSVRNWVGVVSLGD